MRRSARRGCLTPMPLYDACCATCGAIEEVYRKMDNRHDLGPCKCGGDRYIAFRPPQPMRDIEGYVSPIDGKWIGSRSQHREHMKRHGVIELGNEKPKPIERSIPRESIRAEIKNQVERMKSDGTWRER